MNKNLIIFSSIAVIIFGVIILISVLVSSSTLYINKGYAEEKGYVPNEETAIKVAEAIWLSIYGEDIYDTLPFKAEYNKKENCWIVFGTLRPNTIGGVPEIKINRTSGEIIYVNHGK